MTDALLETAEELTARSAAALARADAEARQRRGTRQLLVARALFMVFGYVTSVVLARRLEPAGFGVYGVLLSTLVWLEMVSYAGVPAAMGRLIPEHRDHADQVDRSARFVLFVTSLCVFVIAWLAAPMLARLFHLSEGGRLFRIAILDIPFAAAYQAYSGALMGRRQFGALGASQVVLGAGKFLGVMALLLVGFSVAHALVANAAASVVALVYLVVRYPPKGFRPVAPFVRLLVTLGIPMGAFYGALQILISLDLWFLGSLWRGDRAVLGHYVAALKIAQTLIVIPIVQSGVLLASVAWALSSGDRVGAHRHVLEASRFALILSAAACVVVGTNAGPLMGLIYSERFAAGGRFLVLQLIAFGCFALHDALAHALMAAGRQRIVAIVFVAFIPVVCIANVLLIPRIGPMGAAVSLLVGMVGVAVSMAAVAWREFGPPIAAKTLLRVAVATAVTAVLAAVIPTAGPMLLLEMVLLGAVYLGVLKLLGEISIEDFALPRVKTVQAATAESSTD